jgi:hypothetical protein
MDAISFSSQSVDVPCHLNNPITVKNSHSIIELQLFSISSSIEQNRCSGYEFSELERVLHLILLSNYIDLNQDYILTLWELFEKIISNESILILCIGTHWTSPIIIN